MKIFNSKFEAYKYMLELVQNNLPFEFDVCLATCPECNAECFQYRIHVEELKCA